MMKEYEAGNTAMVWDVVTSDLVTTPKMRSGLASRPAYADRRQADSGKSAKRFSEKITLHNLKFEALVNDSSKSHRALKNPQGEERPTVESGLDHIVVAVKDLDAAVGRYETIYNTKCSERRDNEAAGMKMAFFRFPESYVELVSNFGDKGPIAKRLNDLGEGDTPGRR